MSVGSSVSAGGRLSAGFSSSLKDTVPLIGEVYSAPSYIPANGP